MKKKKKTLALLCMLLCLTSVGLGIAFTTRKVETKRTFSFGNITIAVSETTLDSNGKEVELDLEADHNVTQEGNASRIVRVENVCSHPAYIRMKLTMDGVDDNGESFSCDNLVKYVLNEEDWVQVDSWYYYKKPLEPNTTSEELITEVDFGDINALTTAHPGGKLTLNIDAQAVQSENNADSVLEAAGWPDTLAKGDTE